MHSAKNYVIAGLLITTVLGAGLAWRQHLELVQLRAAALDAQQRAEWQQRISKADDRREEAGQPVDTLPDVTDEEPTEPAAASGASTESPPTVRGANRGGGRSRYAAIMEQPHVQQLLALQHKAGLDARYAALFKRLALSPEQLDQFKNLLVEKNTAAMDVMTAARQQGINPRRDRATVDQLLAEANREIDANIRSVLGETSFAQYKEYEQTAPQRAVVGQLEQRLSYSTTPLTNEQSAQLTRILAATNAATANNQSAPGGGPVFAGRRGSQITDAAINQSLGLLAAPQVDALRQLQQEQQAQAEIAAAFRIERGASRTAPATGTATTPTSGASTPPPPPPPSG